MKLKHLIVMAAIATGACACGHKQDLVKTTTGEDLKITFYRHGSLAFTFRGRNIYIDPVSSYADYGKEPKADVILVTHGHGDHFDRESIEALSTDSTVIITNAEVHEELGRGKALRNGESAAVMPYLVVDAVPAYNNTEGRGQFHPKGCGNGYILTMGGSRIYVAGDTEDIPEMNDIRHIDIALLPVNQPYTMTPEQAAKAAMTVSPKIFYPYHYGEVEERTDLKKLRELLADTDMDIRIRGME